MKKTFHISYKYYLTISFLNFFNTSYLTLTIQSSNQLICSFSIQSISLFLLFIRPLFHHNLPSQFFVVVLIENKMYRYYICLLLCFDGKKVNVMRLYCYIESKRYECYVIIIFLSLKEIKNILFFSKNIFIKTNYS